VAGRAGPAAGEQRGGPPAAADPRVTSPVETGGTVVAYVRRRRMARARHLLQESTMPISAIAATVGMPDLQSLNKACRREFGLAPRALRAEGARPGR
jgi:transcriptional regulator GlxA family with amidase domain